MPDKSLIIIFFVLRVECVIKDPAKMPKNFAMLKILQKHA